MSETLLDHAVTFIGAVNQLLDSVEVPAALQERIEAARTDLVKQLASEDAGIHKGIWSRLMRGAYEDANGVVRGASGLKSSEAIRVELAAAGLLDEMER